MTGLGRVAATKVKINERLPGPPLDCFSIDESERVGAKCLGAGGGFTRNG
jgi:hypothetical protein